MAKNKIRKLIEPEQNAFNKPEPEQMPMSIKPDPNPIKTSVKFNKDNSVDVTSPSGQTYNFSQQEYKEYLSQRNPNSKLGTKSFPVQKLTEEYKPKTKEEQKAAEVNPLLPQIGKLTPEQQMQASIPMQQNPLSLVEQIKENAVRQAAIGGAGGAAAGLTAGIVGAPITAGVSVPVATGLGAAAGTVGGVITGTVTGVFAAYKTRAKSNVKDIDNNVKRAQYNLRQATNMANKGGDAAIAIKAWNDALFELRKAEYNYKDEEKKNQYKWVTEIKDKQVALASYRDNTLPLLEQRFIIALQKPNPEYIDMGLDEDGNPIEGEV